MVVDVADPFQLDPNWLRLSCPVGTTLDATRPNKRLAEICRKSEILFYDSYGDTKRYIEEHGLRFPYLSFSCDRHYDREGQDLMGRLVVRFLRDNHLIPPLTAAALGFAPGAGSNRRPLRTGGRP